MSEEEKTTVATTDTNENIPSEEKIIEHTYTSTKTSDAYTTSKALLAAGEFETALETIETALGSVLSSLPESENNELHPALAPLYYLYGTTLLYSVEESGDAMMPTAGNEQVSNNPSAAAGAAPTEEQAEDIQIAWENLESARTVLENLHAENSSSSMYALDLAQVYHRLGDLSKGNGNYANSIQDYLSALKIRVEQLGPYDRSVADCHYSLAMTYILLASQVEADQNNAAADEEDDTMRRLKKAVKTSATSENAENEAFLGSKEELRRKSTMHYLTCGCTFAGLIGGMCGKKEEEIAKVEVSGENLEGMWWEDEPKKKAATDGKQSHQTHVEKEGLTKFSKALNILRYRVKDLKATDPEQGGVVFDFKELLDEIQETIDSSEESLQAVNDLSKMKAEREGEAEAEDAAALKAGIEASKAASGAAAASAGSTTIGFGNVAAASTASAAATTIGFGATSAATASASTTSTPMMVVKKKKRPVQAEDPSKRPKAE